LRRKTLFCFRERHGLRAVRAARQVLAKNFHGTPRAWAEIRGSVFSGHFAVAVVDGIADGIIAEAVRTVAARATKTGRAAAVADARNAAAAAVARDNDLSGVPAGQAGRGMIAGTADITPVLRGGRN
jgi:hypothetical protein